MRFQETPTTLTIELDIASLDETLEGAVDPEEGKGTSYDVTWRDGATGCITRVEFILSPHANGVNPETHLQVNGGGCDREDTTGTHALCRINNTCHWDIQGEIEYGEPATLRWDVPRSWLPSGDMGGEIQEPHARIWDVTRKVEDEEGDTYVEGDVSLGYYQPFSPIWYVVDESQPADSYDFQTARTPLPTSTGILEVEDKDILPENPPKRPDLDLERFRFEEHEDRFQFTLTLARVDEDPEPGSVRRIGLMLPGQFLLLGDDEHTAWSFLRVDGEEGGAIPVDMTIHPGEPGQMEFNVARADLRPIEPGAPLLSLWVDTEEYNVTEQGVAGHTISRVSWALHEWTQAPLHTLSEDPSALHADRPVLVTDPFFDVSLPPSMFATSPSSFDLVGGQVQSLTPGEMRFALTVYDLSHIEVPPGYDAVLYAIAVEHARGAHMVGHYRSADQPGGLFFCAPDTTVLSEEPGPPQVSWNQISGRISTGGTGGAGGEAAILMFAPNGCFDLPPDADMLNATTMKAGTYAIQRPTGQGDATVETLDTMEAEDGFQASFAQPVEPQAPFWSEPFGIENFWDILGLLVALVTVLVTTGLFVRRRRTFHRYVDEIQRIQETYRHDAQARATALVELRRQLHEDLERHHISDAHYPIVLDRLRARLTSARLTSLGQGFYEVPTRISLRIERLLDDGYLAEEEASVLEPVIEDSDMPEDSAGELIERLRRWLEEDRREVVA